MKKRVRFFLKRSSKVEIQAQKKIVIPFKFATLALLIFMVFISFFLFLRSDIFQINKIEISGKISNCATEDGIKLTTEAVGKSSIFFNQKLAREKILEKFYCIGNVLLTKKYPAGLKIEILERIPIAAFIQIEALPNLATATSSATTSAVLATPSAVFVLDKEGVIFGNLGQNSTLPKIFSPEKLTLGGKISDSVILWLLEFLEKTENYNLSFVEFIKTQEGVIFGKTSDDIQLILSAEKDSGKTAASLQAILREAKIKGTKFSILDLRFEKPILK